MKNKHAFHKWAIRVMLALLILNPAAFSQSPPLGYRLVDLGEAGDWFSEARDINNAGQIVGIVQSTSGSESQRAFIWENGVRRLILTDVKMIANAVNDAGWVAGSFYPGTQQEGYLWQDSMIINLGHLGGHGVYPTGINDMGQVIGIGATASGKVRAFLWENGSIDSLPSPPGWNGSTAISAKGINNNGQIIGDTGFDDGFVHPFIWENGGITLMGLPRSEVHDINDQGYIVGFSFVAFAGFRWKDGVLEEIFPGNVTPAWRINENNQIISFRDSLWQDGTVYDINALLDSSANGWTDIYFYGMNDLGQLVGGGTYQNSIRAILLEPQALAVTAPAADDLWIVGTEDTIKWQNSENVAAVDIWYSVDSGAVYTQIADDYPADSGRYVWLLPDVLSRKCFIRISDAANSDRKGESARFRIKDYELTRVDDLGDYEPFELNQDGWNFGNFFANMWPQSWWQQFDYANGTDPFTNLPYPDVWLGPDIYASPPVFPSWPDFVGAFGVEQCYWAAGAGLYRPSAVQKWKAHHNVRTWRGSCSGFAISSIAAFNDPIAFNNAYPAFPLFIDLHEVALDSISRTIINQLWDHWRGQQHLQFATAQAQKTPKETVKEIAEMLLDEVADDRYLYMASNTGAHAVVPYRMLPLPPDSVAVFIYDSNHPDAEQRFVIVDTVANTWRYRQDPSYSGTQWLYLMDPVSSYYQTPILFANDAESSDALEVNVSAATDVLIRDAAGNQAGYGDGVNFNQIPGALLLIPPTGYESPPEGYALPAGDYRITLSDFSDSTAFLNVFGDGVVYSYSRQDAAPGQEDRLAFSGAGFTLGNPDPAEKTIYQETILINPENERVFDIFNLEVPANDSLRFQKLGDSELLLSNYGGGTSYDLHLLQVSAQAQAGFRHLSVTLEENSAHQIQPDWSDLPNQPVKILIDLGNDGTVDDSLVLSHQPLGTDAETLSEAIPAVFQLYQNYPNPFNPTTVISYQLPVDSDVELLVYNLLGEKVISLVNARQGAGNYQVQWNGRNDAGRPVSSGVYFVRLEADGYVQIRKMLLIR